MPFEEILTQEKMETKQERMEAKIGAEIKTIQEKKTTDKWT
jgi:hypothetical protein